MKMRFFETVWSRFLEAFLRFPLASMLAFAITGFGLYLSYSLDHFTVSEADFILKILFALILTFGLVVAGYLLSEVRKKPEWMFLLPALVLGAGFYLWFDLNSEVWDRGTLEFFDFSFVVAVLISLVPFFGVKKMVAAKKEKGYFAFLGVLLNLILSAFVYFGALYLGLVLVLFSLEFLFDLRLEDRWFMDLFILITGLLVSHFILAGIPKSFDKFEESGLVHAVASFLPKYILAPLTLVYLVVLYAYVAKIGLQMTWPEGGVAGWIIGFSLVGMLTEIVLRYRDVDDFAYVRVLRKVFYWLLVPLIAVLFASLAVRVLDYGMTETRYFGFFMADFILVVTVYNLFSKLKSLRFVTGLLALMTLVAVIGGPISARGMSFNSQVERLGMLLVENGVYVNGELGELPEGLSAEVYEEMRSIGDYLNWSLGASEEVNEYFGVEDGRLEEVLGLGYRDDLDEEGRRVWIDLSYEPKEGDGDYSAVMRSYGLDGNFDYFVPGFSVGDYSYGVGQGVGLDLGEEIVEMKIVDGRFVVDGEIVPIEAVFERLDLSVDDYFEIDDEEKLVFEFEGARFGFEFRLSGANVVVGEDDRVESLENLRGEVLVRSKR